MYKLHLVRSNLHPHFAEIIAATNPRTIDELEQTCRRIESARHHHRDTHSQQQYRHSHARVNVVTYSSSEYEADSDSSDTELECNIVSKQYDNDRHKKERKVKFINQGKEAKTVEIPQSESEVNVVCFNCKHDGHTQLKCERQWKKHCFNCGFPGVIAKDCIKCNRAKNGKVNVVEQAHSLKQTVHHQWSEQSQNPLWRPQS